MGRVLRQFRGGLIARSAARARSVLAAVRAAGDVRRWDAWSLPAPQRAVLVAVTGGYLAWLALLAASTRLRLDDLLLCAALLGCAAVTALLARRAGEPAGIGADDVHVVWELPVVILLPALYALAVPAIRLALVQSRDRQQPPRRRAYVGAATGLAYGCASWVFRALMPAGVRPRDYLAGDAARWLVAAACCALAQWAVNRALVLVAIWSQGPAAQARAALLERESLRNEATELCAAILLSVGVQVSALTVLVAFPMGTLLQRSFRHAQLVRDARADAKTGLLNSAAWEREAVAEVARAVRTSTPLAVALLDLDRFKVINDTHGHLAGDAVLRRIAETMTGVLRQYDLAGRFGGEEFAMLLPQTKAVDALRIAERVRAHIAQQPFEVGGARVPVTVSIGVAALDAGSRRELPELLAAADAALYRAKASGRDQVQMISTCRGLSAVSPPAGLDPQAGADTPPGADTPAGASQEPQPAQEPQAPQVQSPEAVQVSEAAELSREEEPAAGPGAGQPAEAAAEAEAEAGGLAGTASTAITSALPV